jgi:hypothetical protein
MMFRAEKAVRLHTKVSRDWTCPGAQFAAVTGPLPVLAISYQSSLCHYTNPNLHLTILPQWQMHHGLDVRMRGISTSADYTNMQIQVCGCRDWSFLLFHTRYLHCKFCTNGSSLSLCSCTLLQQNWCHNVLSSCLWYTCGTDLIFSCFNSIWVALYNNMFTFPPLR